MAQTYIYTFRPQTRKDAVCSSRYGPVLTLQDQSNRARFAGVDWEGIPREERDDDASSPRSSLLERSDNSVHDCVSDLVLDWDTVDNRRGDEELVLDVDKVFRQLNGCVSAFFFAVCLWVQLTLDVGILNRMLDLLERVHTPRSNASADLHLARPAQLEIFQLPFNKVGRGKQERHLALVILPSALERSSRLTFVRMSRFHR